MEPIVSKECLKKRRQREQIRADPIKNAKQKKKDAERKQLERSKRKVNKATAEHEKALNRERVRRHREKKAIETSASRTDVEKNNEETEIRKHLETKRRETRDRVRNYRLRIKLSTQSESTTTCDQPSTSGTGSAYKHRSSESRALRKVTAKMPSTPAKKVKLIEKMVQSSTPRTRKAIRDSKVLANVSRKQLDMDSEMMNIITQVDPKKKKVYKNVCQALARKMKAADYTKLSRRLKLDKRTLKKYRNIEIKNRHGNAISSEDEEKVRQYYLNDISRPMPNAKDVIHVKDSDGVRRPVSKHLLVGSQQEALKGFKVKFPDVKISQRKFDMLKPLQCKRIKASNRVVCCCTYCENVSLKSKTINGFLTGINRPTMTSSELLVCTMCPKGDAEFHAKICIERECDRCGVKLLKEKMEQIPREQSDKKVKWSEWTTIKETYKGKEITKTATVTKEGTYSELIQATCNDLEKHAGHRFRTLWQQNQFQDSVMNLQKDEAVLVMDFAENYTCRKAREAQAYHWNQTQITLHPMMAYYYKKDGEEYELQKEGIIAITEDTKHDSFAVSTFEKVALDHLQKKTHVARLHEWTDGCAGQYKGATAFANVSLFPDDFGIPVIRNFFETSHGKSPCDGIGGTVKHKAHNAVLHGKEEIQCAAQLVDFCQRELSNVGSSTYQYRRSKYDNSHRTFVLVETNEIDRNKPERVVKTLPGTRKLHSIRSTDTRFNISTRHVSCYCKPCIYGEDSCENLAYGIGWKDFQLKIDNKSNSKSNLTEKTSEEPEQSATKLTETRQPIKIGSYIAISLDTEKKRKLLYIAVVQAVTDTHVTVKFLRQVTTGVFKDAEHEDTSTEPLINVLFTCLEPQLSLVAGNRLRYSFDFNDKEKEMMGTSSFQ